MGGRTMSVADANRVILTGENPFIRLSERDGDPNKTDASFWRIYSDNIAMTRWLQSTVQGMLNAELKDTSIPVTDAAFSKSGDYRDFWTERLVAHGEEIALTWYRMGDPLMIHTQPNATPDRP